MDTKVSNKICIIIGCYKNHHIVNNVYDFIIKISNNFDIYLVNNNNEVHKNIILKYSNKFIVVEGDNSHYEFSGIQKCLNSINKDKYSLFILGTDALLNYPIKYLDFINRDTIDHVMVNETFAGNIDTFMKDYKVHDFVVNYWIRTSLVMINKKLFEKINYQFITYECNDLFDLKGNFKIKIDPELEKFLNEWLSNDRYKYIKNMKIKKSCILNEWKFTNKLIKYGKILDYSNGYLLNYNKEIMTKYNKMVLLANEKYVPYTILTNIENKTWEEQIKLKTNLFS